MKTRQQAAEEYARNHSNAPDKETPDWIIQDFLAGWESAEQNRWIPVSERLPNVGYWVLARSWRGTVMASYWKNEWRVYNHNAPGNFMSIDDITHWMPLPEPPQPFKD